MEGQLSSQYTTLARHQPCGMSTLWIYRPRDILATAEPELELHSMQRRRPTPWVLMCLRASWSFLVNSTGGILGGLAEEGLGNIQERISLRTSPAARARCRGHVEQHVIPLSIFITVWARVQWPAGSLGCSRLKSRHA